VNGYGIHDRPGDEPGPITETVEHMASVADAPDFSVRRFVEELGHCSFAHMLLWPALIVVSPLSGIPGLSSLVGISIALISLQMILGRKHLWLPQWLLRQHIPQERFRSALTWLQHPVGAIERMIRPRMGWMFIPPMRALIELCCMCCGLAMPFLELVPLTSSILGCAVALFATSLITEDGFLALGGLATMALATAVLSGFVAGA
jgi:hypothetical protein